MLDKYATYVSALLPLLSHSDSLPFLNFKAVQGTIVIRKRNQSINHLPSIFIFPEGFLEPAPRGIIWLEMAEEQRRRCEAGHRLCANNCGFFGSPATLNLCSNCYHASSAAQKTLFAAAVAANTSCAMSMADGCALTMSPPTRPATVEEEGEKKAMSAGARRCASCRKRVGLVGFPCRCGFTFCGVHRHAERHTCTYDFKAAGREVIALENPLVKADKLQYKI